MSVLPGIEILISCMRNKWSVTQFLSNQAAGLMMRVEFFACRKLRYPTRPHARSSPTVKTVALRLVQFSASTELECGEGGGRAGGGSQDIDGSGANPDSSVWNAGGSPIPISSSPRQREKIPALRVKSAISVFRDRPEQFFLLCCKHLLPSSQIFIVFNFFILILIIYLIKIIKVIKN
jgi:hypothetical protein